MPPLEANSAGYGAAPPLHCSHGRSRLFQTRHGALGLLLVAPLLLGVTCGIGQEEVEGDVRMKHYKGNDIVTGRRSPKSLYSDALVTFEDDRGAYDQKDAEGFIRLNGLRLRTLGARNRR